MNNEIVISIIIPTYNRSNKITKLISKFLEISDNQIEIIIIDDGSSDNTKIEINKINNKIIKYYYIENSERGYARNFGFKKSKGKYINFFDSDDMPLSNHISVAKKIISNKGFYVFHTSFIIERKLKKNKLYFFNGVLNSKIIKKNILSLNNVFIKREILIHNLFCDNRKLSGTEDWFLWIKIAKNYKIHGIKTITSKIIDDITRSTSLINYDDLENRVSFIDNFLKVDDYFKGILNDKQKNFIMAEMISLLCLYSSFKKNKIYTVNLFFKSIKLSYNTLFRMRNVIIIKNLFFNI